MPAMWGLLWMLLAGVTAISRHTGRLPKQQLSDVTLNLGTTTPKFKQDIVDLFRSQRYLSSSAMDIGAGLGGNTAALAMNFGTVLATDLFWELDRPDGYRIDYSRLLRTDGSSFNNIVSLHIDASTPHSFSMLAAQNVTVCAIDAQHDFQHILKETFAVLREIPCCMETIVYHDYCDSEVFASIQFFVSAGILEFRCPIGEPNWWHFWCRDGRSEGAAMKVTRGRDFHERVEVAYQ